jgi:hypothetical protein
MWNNSKTEQGRVTVLVHCTSSHCQKHPYQVWSHLNLWWQSYAPDKKCYIKVNQMGITIKRKKGRVTVLVHCTLIHCQKTSIPSLESFESMVTKLRSGQDMLYKNQSKGIIKKRNKVELRFLCTALWVIARNMHTKFGVIWTYVDKVRLRTRKSGRRRQRRRHRRRKKSLYVA